MTTCKTSNDFELKVLAVDKLKYRKAKVADKIENDLLPLIKQLREKNLSWNQISEYIRKYHRKKISRSYLHKICSCEINKSELIE
jgi:intein-encoded DNA endonuclease-like protein